MKICAAELLPALSAVTKAVQRRNTIPILSNVKFTASGDRLQLAATDLAIQITTSLACETGEENIATTVPARTLEEIVRKLPEKAAIDISHDGSNMLLRSGHSKFTLSTLPVDDMPEFDATNDWACSFALAGNVLEQLNRQVFFAISSDETRYYLNGIFWHANEEQPEKLVSVATDGHSLAELTTPLDAPVPNLPPVIVPRGLWQIVKGFFVSNEPVTISLSDAKVCMEQGETKIVSKLIDGTFPDYQRVVPQDKTNGFIVNRADLLAAIDRVLILSSEKSQATKFSFLDGKVCLRLKDMSQGLAEDEVVLEDGSSETPFEIGFNARFVAAILAACVSDQVVFYLSESGNAARIEEVGNDNAVFVLMPMRI